MLHFLKWATFATIMSVGFAVHGWGVDVEYKHQSAAGGQAPGTAFLNESTHPAAGSNAPNANPFFQQAGYAIHDGRLHVATVRISTVRHTNYDSSGNVYYTYTWGSPQYSWDLAGSVANNGWQSGNNNMVNIVTSNPAGYFGDATGIGNGIAGSGNTVNLSGNGNVTGTLNMHTDNNAGNTLQLGYYNGSANSGGAIAGTVNVNWGNINIHDGSLTGTITASHVNTTTATQDGGTVAGAIQVAGARSTYAQSGGIVRNGAKITYTGDDTKYTMTGGTITDAGTTITYSGANAQFDQSTGTVTNSAKVIYTGDKAEYIQNSGTVGGRAEVRYTGAGSKYTLNGGTITDTGTQVNFTSDYITYFEQTGGDVTNSAAINYKGSFSEYNQSGGNVKGGAKVIYDGLGAKYNMSGGLITDNGTLIRYNGNRAQFNQTGGDVANLAQVYYRGVDAQYNQSGGTVQSGAKITYFDAGSKYTLSGNGLITGRGTTVHFMSPQKTVFNHQNNGTVTDQAAILYNGRRSEYNQRGGTVSGGATITYTNTDTLYNMTGGTITDAGTTITYNGANAKFNQSAGTVTTSAKVIYQGNNAQYNQSAGKVERGAEVRYTGAGSSYNLSGTGLITDPGTQVNFTSLQTTYFNQTGGTVDNQAAIDYRGAGSQYNQSDGTVSTAATITYHGDNAQYNMTGGLVTDKDTRITYLGDSAQFNQSDGIIRDRAEVTYHGGNAQYNMTGGLVTTNSKITFHGPRSQLNIDNTSTTAGTSRITGNAQFVYNGVGSSLRMDEVAPTSPNAEAVFDHGSITFNGRHSTGDMTGGSITSINGTDFASVNYLGGDAYFELHGDADSHGLISGDAELTFTNGNNTFEQYGGSPDSTEASIVQDNAVITMIGDNNAYLQHGDSIVGGDTVTTLTNDSTSSTNHNTLYGHYENAIIKDQATINLIVDENNRFHMYGSGDGTDANRWNPAHTPTISDTATVNINRSGSKGNHFLMDAGVISTAGKTVGGVANSAININGANTRNNTFTQTGGRVSTAPLGSSVANGAKINLNGMKSRQNIFELTNGFNDYEVLVGSNDAATPANNTSTHGIYHQSGGRKNGDVTITGSKNLFWVNGNADYYAKTEIHSGVDAVNGNNSGSNLAVVDLFNAGTGKAYHSRPHSPLDSGDTIHANNPAFMGTLDLSKTVAGRNNLFLANGDVYGAITTSGMPAANQESSSYVYVGYTADENANNPYSWLGSNSSVYNPTGLTLPGATAVPHAGHRNGPYFNLAGQVNRTRHLNVKEIVGGGGEVHAKVSAGNAYNIKAMPAAAANDAVNNRFSTANNVFPFMFPVGYTNGGYSIIYQKTPSPAVGKVPGSYHSGSSYGANFRHTADFFNNGDYVNYSLLNMDAVNVGGYHDEVAGQLRHSPTNLTIGAIKDGGYDNTYDAVDLSSSNRIPTMSDTHFREYYQDSGSYTNHGYDDFYSGYQAQITAGIVNVYGGSKLTIHPNHDAYNGVFDPEDAADPRRNVINNLNIVGNPDVQGDCEDCGYSTKALNRAVVTIDRTTIHTDPAYAAAITRHADKRAAGYDFRGDYTANVVVSTNGILQGFGEITSDTDHSPKHPNIIGDVAVLSGGMLRTYDAAQQDDGTGNTLIDNQRGIFVVHGNAMTQYPLDYNPNFEDNADRLKGLYLKINGNVHLESASRISTRLFSNEDGTNTLDILSDGEDRSNLTGPVFTPKGDMATVTKYWGDGIVVGGSGNELDFSEIAYNSVYLKNGVHNRYAPTVLAGGIDPVTGLPIEDKYYANIDYTDVDRMKEVWRGVAQGRKVQYVPTFGFVNELKTKLEYNVYKGGDQSGIQSYYYQVLYADANAKKIQALEGMEDANHLFDRDILFSDMLGNWSFLKQDNDKGIVLRYRLLAKHPHEGGITVDQKLRNSREVAMKLDEIRYPFFTRYNMADSSLDGLFIKDPSLDGRFDADGNPLAANEEYRTPEDHGVENGGDDPFYAYDGNPYDQAGFDGDIETYYREHQNRFSNYKDDWVHDIANYFHALQLNVESVDEIHRSLRLLSAEAYASQANADLMSMNMFINSRERNAVSALYMVEAEPQPVADVLIPKDGIPVFVRNPIRIWASSLGYHDYQSRVGEEYGYHTHSYGLQIGAIKELGDVYLGLTTAYTRSNTNWSQLQSKNTSHNIMGELLFGVRRGLGFLEFHGNAGYMNHKMGRSLNQGKDLNGGEYDPDLDCDPDDNYYNGVYKVHHAGNHYNRILGGGVRFGYQKVLGEKWLFLPTIGFRFQDIRNASSFTEKGPHNAAFRLAFDKGGIKRQSLQVPLTLRLSRSFTFDWIVPTIVTPELRAGATLECMDRNGEAEYRWIGNPIPNRYMRAWGLEEDRLSYLVGATIEVSRRGRMYTAINYDLSFRRTNWKENLNHNFSVQAGLNF